MRLPSWALCAVALEAPPSPSSSVHAPHEVARLRAHAPPLVAHADEIFSRTSPYPGHGLRNHCWRLYELTQLLLADAPRTLDDAELYLAAMVHDLGLVTPRDRGENYLARSVALLGREVHQLAGLGDAKRRALEQCLLYNHRLRGPAGLCQEAEAFRRAVQIEHSGGLLGRGLDGAQVAAVMARHPRAEFGRVLVDFAWRVLRHEPHTVVRGIFFAGGSDGQRAR